MGSRTATRRWCRAAHIGHLALGRQALIVGSAALLSAMGGVATAIASTGIGQLNQFGQGTVLVPSATAVDQATGTLYVAALSEPGTPEIFAFDPSTGAQLTPPIDGATTPQGLFSELQGVVVDQQSHDIYVLAGEEIDQFTADGEYLSQFAGAGEEPGTFPLGDQLGGIAQDPTTGDLLVSNQSDDEITRFTAAGQYVSQFGRPGSGNGQFSDPTALAVDSNADVYVLDAGNGRVEKLAPTGTFLSTLPASAPTAIAVDAATQNVYVGDAGSSGYYGQPGAYHVLEYGPSGTLLDDFAYGSIGGSAALAFDDPTDDLLVADREQSDIAVFGATTLPGAITQPPAGHDATVATLAGTVQAAGGETRFYFQYGTTIEYGAEGPEAPGELVEGSSDPVTALVTGLEANTTYHYRLLATNPAGTTFGHDLTFTTEQAAPGIDEQAGVPKGSTEAELTAYLRPGNLATAYHFEYVAETGYQPTATNPFATGQSTPMPDANAGTAAGTVAQPITGLQPSTTYYFRLVATNAANGLPSTTAGEPSSFTTPALPPVATVGPVVDITQTAATLQGSVNPSASSTTYQFVYQDRPACFPFGGCFPKLAPEVPAHAGSADTTVPVSVHLANLKPATTYYYTLATTNAGGVANAPTMPSFKTLPLPPGLTTSTGTITPDSATVLALVEPHGGATTYQAEFGPTTAYGSTAPDLPGAVLATEGDEAVAAKLLGLLPETNYHYRVLATNQGGVTDGPDETFTTSGHYALPATATTNPTATVTDSTAVLSGTVDPQGTAVDYAFEYGPTAYYGTATPLLTAPLQPGGAAASVLQTVSSLLPATAYHYRLVAFGSGGTTYGQDATFTTLPGTATVTTTLKSPAQPARPAINHKSVSPAQIRTQLFNRALKACEHQYPRSAKRRAACDTAARAKYAPNAKQKKSKR